MAEFELRIATDIEKMIVRLKLFRADGEKIGSNEICLPEYSLAFWEGLFDTRRYVKLYEKSMIFDNQTEPATSEMLLMRLGMFLGEKVLGEEIVRALAGHERRVLIVRLPTPDKDILAAAFSRVPWEIARLSEGTQLQNIVLRAITEDTAHGNVEIIGAAKAVTEGETLRVLAVFAETPGTRPLAMRREREELFKLFANKILPHHNVEIDILCHGVTRKRLKEAIRSRRGYHIIHWSGHGHHNALNLQGEPNNIITGESLVEMFIEAGGFIPQIFFLSACHSGSMLKVKDWHSLQESLEWDEQPQSPSEELTRKATTEFNETKKLDDAIKNPSGYTGTALALLKMGVPQVVAMRYAVGDEYARKLAIAFYTRLLADHESNPTEEALAMARVDVQEDTEQSAYHVVDHATPLMFGQPGVLLKPKRCRSRQMEHLRPKPQPLLFGGRSELDPSEVFVGRGEPLTRLGSEWLGEGNPAVVLLQGLAGLGKTVLAAEVIHLWHNKFDFVLAFQAKPNALQFDDFCHQLDQRLTIESPTHRSRCERNSLNHIYLSHNSELFPTPKARYERMQSNLVEALRDEAILLVIDNFEKNLESLPSDADSSSYASSDPVWDELLTRLVRDLPTTRSRMLVTSRHRLQALAESSSTIWIPLGTLPMNEAALFVRSHPELRRLLFSKNESDKELIWLLLKVSRGHPLILDRLARIASDPTVLHAALDRIQADGWQQLPDLFDVDGINDTQRETERKYLEDVVISSIDLLIERITPDARRLLRIISMANEPVSRDFIEGIWQGKSVKEEMLGEVSIIFKHLELLPDDVPWKQRQIDKGKQFLEQYRNISPKPKVTPIVPILTELLETGLLTKEESGQMAYSFHELIRERMIQWKNTHKDETDIRTDEEILIAYGERYEKLFNDLYHTNRNASGEAGRRALVYFVTARNFERVGSLTSKMVIGVNDPTLLNNVLDQLKGVINQVPPGKIRWSMRTNVAGILNRVGQSNQAISFYSEAAKEAEVAGDWEDVAASFGEWATAWAKIGNLEKAKEMYLRSVEVYRRIGKEEATILGFELEALRIDVERGKVETALPKIESRLDQIRDWRRRRFNGESVNEAPDLFSLHKTLVSGLDVVRQAHIKLKHWQKCLDLTEEEESTKRFLGENEVELAGTRFNQYGPLMMLGRLQEAQRVLEDCLNVFRSKGVIEDEARCLVALASIWDKRNDFEQAIAFTRQALVIFNVLPDPGNRATCHHNLAGSLSKLGKHDEARSHWLAAIIYNMLMGINPYDSLHNIFVDAGSIRYKLPKLKTILVHKEFVVLRQFLDNLRVDRVILQVQLDLFEQAYKKATRVSDSPMGNMTP